MYQEFKHQQALIIGGSSGIGRAVAEILLTHGTTVTIVGRNSDKLQAARSHLEQFGKVQIWQADISDHQDTSRLIERITSELSSVNYLVNSAGVFSPKTFLDHSEEDYDLYLNSLLSL
jgi:short-subunit dehydrogenase